MVRNMRSPDEHRHVNADSGATGGPASSPPPGRASGRSRSTGRWVAVLLALALLAVGAWFVYDALTEDDDATAAGGGAQTAAGVEDAETVPASVGATAGEIADDPDGFIGRWVSVSGEISRVVSPTAFLLGGDEFVGDDELLVVGADIPAVQEKALQRGPIAQDDIMGVIGPVREFELAAVERELGTDLDDATFEPYDGRPFVLAQDVHVTPRKPAGGAAADNDAAVVAVADIAADPSRFRGGTVTVTGTVSEALGPNVVRLDDALVVVGLDGAVADADDGDVLKVTGTVASLNASEIRARLGRDLPNAVIQGLAGRAVLIARTAEKV